MKDKNGEVSSKQSGVAKAIEPKNEPLDKIVNDFNRIFGDIGWEDRDNVIRQIEKIPKILAKDQRKQMRLKKTQMKQM